MFFLKKTTQKKLVYHVNNKMTSVVNLSKYEPIVDPTSFIQLGSEVLSRDEEHFPVFLPNERVDMKIVSNNKGDYRVAASAKKRYVKTLRIADRNIVSNIFDIYRLKEKDNEFLLIYRSIRSTLR